MTIKEMQEKRFALVQDAQAILDKVEAESRSATAQERESVDKMYADVDKLGAQIEEVRADEKRSERAKALADEMAASAGKVTKLDSGKEERTINLGGKEVRVTATQKQMEDFRSFLLGERRSHSIVVTGDDADVNGGYTVPDIFAAQLIKGVDDAVFMRQYATKNTLTKGDTLTIPVLTGGLAASWAATEITDASESTATFSQVAFALKYLNCLSIVSKPLLRHSALNVESIIKDRLAAGFAEALDDAYINGATNGATGIFSEDAIIGRDQTTASATGITADNVLDVYYSLKPSYRRNATWVLGTTGVKKIRQLKDDNGQYIWQAGLNGSPDTIMQRPYIESANCPDTWTTGNYVGCLADLSYYYIVDSLNMEVQTLIEKYAISNQIGYVARMQSDGKPVLAEAFSLIKTA